MHLSITSEESGIIIAAISVIGVFFTTIISLHISKRNSYIETVSRERTKWLASFRDELGDFCVGIELIKNMQPSSIIHNSCKIISKANKAKYVLISRLKTNYNHILGNELNFELKQMIELVDFYNPSTVKNFDMHKFMRIVNSILENEWEKTKNESRQ